MEQPVISCDFLGSDVDLAHITTSINTLKIVSLKEAKELLDYNTIENVLSFCDFSELTAL